MLKKIFSLTLAIAIVLSLAGCGSKGNKKSPSSKKGTNAKPDYVSSDTKEDQNNNNASSSKKNSGDKSESVSSGSAAPEKGDSKAKPSLADKNYGGKTFTFYFWYQTDDIINRRVAAFNDAHNAKVQIKVLAGNFEENIAKSIASGTPYDMIANHDMYFPQSVFANIYEPLDGYIDARDYLDSAKPANGGLSKSINDHFTWGGKLYAAGSAKSVYGFVIYYNKRGLEEDPYQLWKNGKWTWDKYMEIGRDIVSAGGFCYLELPPLSNWLTLNGVDAVKRNGDSFAENLGNSAVVNAIKNWHQLMFGSKPVSLANGGAFGSGFSCTLISSPARYNQLAENAKNTPAFGNNASNLGVVPIPPGLTPGGAYPAISGQGYSAAKGAKEPSLPACYALFESRFSDSDTGSSFEMPAEILNYVGKEIATNGFVGFGGLADSEDTSISSIVTNQIGRRISGGADLASTVSAQRSVITEIINDCLSRAK